MQSEIIKEKSKKTFILKYGVDHNLKSHEIREKSKNTLIKNYGVDNPSKSSIIQSYKKETILKNMIDDVNYNEKIDIKRKNTNMLNRGVEYPMQSYIVREKSKVSILENWGVDHNSKSPLIRENIKKTNLECWGYEHTLQSPLIRENIKKTNLEKYGFEYTLQSPIIRENIKKTNLEKYGVEHIRQSESYREYFKICNHDDYLSYISNGKSLFSCNKGHTFEITSDNYHSRINGNIPLCTICYPIGDSKSIKEKELLEYIKSVYTGEIISSYRDGLEIDIYLPGLKLGFEFNGLYWHSDKFKHKNYHLDKNNYFKEKDIRIFHVWEDDWILKKDIIKNNINNLLNINNVRIFVRKCLVKEVNIEDCKEFLNDNHIKGVISSTIKIGLYYNNELLSLMTFDSEKLGDWNLNRFCSKIGMYVVGGPSKLLTYFIKNYDVKCIVSYVDSDWSIVNLYKALGFNNTGENIPDYRYIVDSCRVDNSEMVKGFLKIYDCGKIKFEKMLD